MAGTSTIYVTYNSGCLERQKRGEQSTKIRPAFVDADEIFERNNTGGPRHVPGMAIAVNFERQSCVQFSHGFGSWKQKRLSTPELRMMQLMCDVMDDKDWHEKLCTLDFMLRWQVLATSEYKLSLELWLWCQAELHSKAKRMDHDKRGIASDTNKYLVSPWLYPFWLGQSPIKTDGSRITIERVGDHVGGGVFPPAPFWDNDTWSGEKHYYSPISQWIATDIKFVGHSLMLVSPINNLHAQHRKSLYAKIEALLPSALRDWNKVLLYKSLQRNGPRIKPQAQRCESCRLSNGEDCSCVVHLNNFDRWTDGFISPGEKPAPKDRSWDPMAAIDGAYDNSERLYGGIALENGFREKGLQIYVEISAIEVSAQNTITEESYSFDTRRYKWDLNGNRNERIVATTLICLRRTNIHPECGRISFRSETKLRDWGVDAPPGSQHLGSARFPVPLTAPSPVLGIEKKPMFQELGSALLPEGRTLTFPNALQHRFEPLIRCDESKPGSLQFMAIHLVDPHYRVCSTRHIAPQSVSWWWDSSGLRGLFQKHRVCPELRCMILNQTRDGIRDCYAEHMREPEEDSDTIEGIRAAVRFIWGDELIGEDGKPRGTPLSHRPDESIEKPAADVPLRSAKGLRMRRSAIWNEHASVMAALEARRVYGVPEKNRLWYRNLAPADTIIDHSDPEELDKAPVNAFMDDNNRTTVAPDDLDEQDIETDSEFDSDGLGEDQ
ncbi:hypothetical protein NLG97_g3324 [Lecanicillium saksenae]|uniref:Uncharacterized protein n=1 Tax=Lecanicillium saksenae TaxID=468837 RepID=A0ACC1R1P2_9HYPO|nr:hypothetical protein NLG97_g3324 [Lecanicillium saksenae]